MFALLPLLCGLDDGDSEWVVEGIAKTEDAGSIDRGGRWIGEVS